MPTAADHRAEASSLTDVLDSVRVARASLLHDRDDPGLQGGATHLVRGGMAASATDLDELGRLVGLLVDELHRRAVLCDQYTAELARYGVEHQRWTSAVQRYRATADTDRPAPWPGPEPIAPSGPFAGAVAG